LFREKKNPAAPNELSNSFATLCILVA